MITLSADRIIDKVVRSYDPQESQKTIEVQSGNYLLFLDCRFIHNDYKEIAGPDSYIGTETISRLVNFYIYEATLYKDGEFIKDKDWEIDRGFGEVEQEIWNQIKE